MEKYRFLISIFLLCLISANPLVSQDSLMQVSIDKVTSDKIFKHTNLSISVYDTESHSEIASHRSHAVLTPASTMKLFSSLTGLLKLGEEFTFKTTLGYNGKINSDGTLDGDIVIKGGGDPTLGSSRMKGCIPFDELLKHWTKVIIDAGITCINGDIIVDESICDSYPVSPSWQWNDLGNYYASGAWGLNINENQYTIYFKNRNVIGNRPSINSVHPKVPKLNLSNEILIDSSNTGDQAYIFGGPYNYDKRIVGTIPQGSGLFSIKGSIPDPPLFTAFHLKESLLKENIQAKKIKTNFYSEKKRVQQLDTISSPPLKDIVRKLNLESNNLYAESILKYLGYKLRGQGSGQNGIATIFKTIRSYKLKNKHLFFHDGSGLSVRNLVSSHTLAGFLSHVTKDLPESVILNSIPKGGIEGTVKGMFYNSKIKGNVWVKSGSMETIQGYAGYVRGKNGKLYSFSVIVNGFSDDSKAVRKKLEKIISSIYRYSS